jgi:flavin-dependent dehydrogenase
VGARVVVAADGLTSPILAQALAGTSSHVTRDSRIGFGGVFAADGAADYTPGTIHMAVGRAGYVGLVRLEDGRLDVAAALDTAAGRPEELVVRILRDAGFPALSGAPDSGWRGTPALTRRPEALGAERVLAVGDAAGYVEPFTGEGITWALAGARSLAPLVMEGIQAWRPSLVTDWEEAHAAGIGQAARLCRAVAWTLRRPRITRTGIRVLRRFPAAATPVIRHLGRPPVPSLESLS